VILGPTLHPRSTYVTGFFRSVANSGSFRACGRGFAPSAYRAAFVKRAPRSVMGERETSGLGLCCQRERRRPDLVVGDATRDTTVG
jgi:hypothetical protein